MILSNAVDEYHLQPKGLGVLNDLENLGYLARHKVAAAEADEEEYEEREETGDDVILIIAVVILLFVAFSFDSCLN